jgi:hypothetical protein
MTGNVQGTVYRGGTAKRRNVFWIGAKAFKPAVGKAQKRLLRYKDEGREEYRDYWVIALARDDSYSGQIKGRG